MNIEIVTNDLLAFLQQKQVDLTDEAAAILVLTEKYSESEIDVSKRLLFTALKKTHHMVARRCDEAKENAQDIVTLFKNTDQYDMPVFMAKEFPQPNVSRLLIIIAHLKRRLAEVQSQLAEVQSQLAKTKRVVPVSPPPKLIEPEESRLSRGVCGRSRLMEIERNAKMNEVPIVSVEQGQLQGRVILSDERRDRHFYSFQGIPYAKPPLGSLRFTAPQPPEPWEGVRTATSEGNMAPQIDLFFSKAYAGDEDCLFLNVYTPTLKGATLPVMIFIHGGDFSFGSGNTNLYGADYLVVRDVVVVTLNYRCGALGFLSLNTHEVPGNAGLKDIVQAIRWVKTNVQNFGGNADNITIFGENAGGAAVCYLTASPLTNKLVHKAIIQSATMLGTFALQKTPLENARTIAKILGFLGCDSSDSEEILEFLRARSAEEIVHAQQKMNQPEKILGKLNKFTVVVEKEFPGIEAVITESFYDLLTSGRVAEIPIMIGVCSLKNDIDFKLDDLKLIISDEANMEILEKVKEIFFKCDDDDNSELISDRITKVDTHRVVQHLVQTSNAPIYYYNFEYVGALNICHKLFQRSQEHAGHMDELGYLFKNDFQTDLPPVADRIMRHTMVTLWTNFAKWGHSPPIEDRYLRVTWRPVTENNQNYLNIGRKLTMQSDIDKEKMEFWDNYYRKYFRIGEQWKTNTQEGPVKDNPPVIVDRIPSKATVNAPEISQLPDADKTDANSPKRRRI